MRWTEITDSRLDEKNVFHGTTSDFDEFNFSKVNSGSGAQTYGWGIYFTDTRAIAVMYQNRISEFDSDREILVRAMKYGDNIFQAYSLLVHGSEPKFVFGVIAKAAPSPGNVKARMIMMIAKYLIKKRQRMGEKNQGSLFVAEIPSDDSSYLLWNAPMEAQSPAIQKIASEVSEKHPKIAQFKTGQDFYVGLSRILGGDKKASMFLSRSDICGVKYRDDDHRAGEGEFNYVIFDKRFIKVLSKSR